MKGPEVVGRYTLVRPLAQGGMAEIFLAHQEGPGGFQKHVIVKRVLAQYATSEDFVSMFLDEARLAAMLSHPNIVQVFDFGQEGDAYYLAMELLLGEDLSNVLRRGRKRAEPMPYDAVAGILAQACEGLHYAHTFVAPDGTPLHIVHRDVSPSNLFVTYQGAVKVLDFGIAKAEGKVLKTKTGVLKGKHVYMSPEQIHGDELTGQSDVWALGVVLYEMLTYHRVFQRENELGVLKAILDDDIPRPREHRPDIPLILEEIAMTALARDRANRFASADEMRDALRDASGSAVGHDAAKAWLAHLFGDDAAKNRLAEFSSAASEVSDSRRAAEGGTPISSAGRGAVSTSPTAIDDDGQGATLVSSPGRSRSVVPAVMLGASGVLALGGAAALFLALKTDPEPAPLPEPVPLAAVAADPVDPTLDDDTPAAPPRDALPDEAPQADAQQAEAQQAKAPLADDVEERKRSRRRSARSKGPPGELSVGCSPWCRIYVDGNDLQKNSPARGIKLRPGKHVIKVVNPPTGKSATRTITVGPGEALRELFQL